MSTPVRSVDEVCVAIEQVLLAHYDATMAGLGFTDGYAPVKTWTQLPALEAIATAELPAGAIVAPTGVDSPTYQASSGLYRYTWRVPIGIYERGRDHNQTQGRIRNRVAGIRTTLLQHKSLGGIATALAWSGENYGLLPAKEVARTLAAGAVSFDVTADVTLDPLPTVPPTPGPVVTSTQSTVTVRRRP